LTTTAVPLCSRVAAMLIWLVCVTMDHHHHYQLYHWLLEMHFCPQARHSPSLPVIIVWESNRPGTQQIWLLQVTAAT